MSRLKCKGESVEKTCLYPFYLLSFAFCLFLVSACSFQRVVVNDPITSEEVAFITRGETPLREVVAKLGAPQEVTSVADRNIFRYRYRVSKSFRINFGVLFRIIAPASLPLTTLVGNTHADTFEVAFDRAGIVQDYTFRLQAEEARFNPWPF